MRTRHFIFISVILNVALLVGAAMVFRPSAPAAAPEAPAATNPGPLVQKTTRTHQVNEPDQVIALDWKKVESGDYKTYIVNLRAVGCPEETIRDIIIADINKLYSQKWRQMNPVREYKYWRHGRSSGEEAIKESNERRKNRDALLREKRQLVRELVGVDLAEDGERYADPSFRGSSADMQIYDFLPVAKRQLFREIQDRYQPLFQRIFDNLDPDNYMSPEVRKELAALRKQAEAEMQQALTPEELEQFQLRFSNTAQSLRNNLAGFEPTEDEFRRIYAARRTVDQQFETADPADKQTQQLRAEAIAKLNEDLKRALTPERYAQYTLSQDPAYRDALSFASAWDLPAETINALYGIRQAAEKRAQELPAEGDERREKSVTELRTEVVKGLRETLGEKVYDSYRRTQPWLRSLGRR